MTDNTKTPPRRAYELKLAVSADSLDALIGYLRTFETDLRMGKVTRGASGGYSSGATYDLSVDETITHDKWEDELAQYVAWMERSK